MDTVLLALSRIIHVFRQVQRKVSKKDYATTSNSVRACFATNRTTYNTTNSFQKMEVIRGSLGTTGLESKLDGHGTEPVITSTNPFGFIERRILNVEVTNDVGEKSIKRLCLTTAISFTSLMIKANCIQQ